MTEPFLAHGAKTARLQGKVSDIRRTGESIIDRKGNKFEKCVFTVALTNFSAGTTDSIPEEIKGRKVKLLRYYHGDWQPELGAVKTLEPDETEAVLSGKPSEIVYW